MSKRVALAASLMAALSVAGTAVAGNGAASNKTSSWISAPVVVSSSTAVPTTTSATSPQYGDTITFDVSTTQTSDPFVNVTCYQNGVLVMNAWSAFFPGGLGDGTFGLGSPVWQSGAADCTANLDMASNNNKWKVLASTSFHVNA